MLSGMYFKGFWRLFRQICSLLYSLFQGSFGIGVVLLYALLVPHVFAFGALQFTTESLALQGGDDRKAYKVYALVYPRRASGKANL